MDRSLVGWARAVKARRGPGLPTLWLFTDPARTPDPVAAVRALPRGLCGVVFRHGGLPGEAALLRRLARTCRERRLVLVAAGVNDLPAGVGRHLRGGWRHAGRRPVVLTSSAHDRAELVRAGRSRADLIFLSPVFPTASHVGARALGPARWGSLTRDSRQQVAALGGVTGANAGRLPRWAAGIGAIGALLP